MYLKSLELSGFKSFAKKTSLEFSTPITAVVGPNGSGKSNIAEAFRFVLGEQSIKSMRGKRTEDLIWNGGGDAARANRAAVKVTFDNSRRTLNVDFDEVSLERVIYRDSSSEYLINGTQVRLKDIIELLAAAHIGSSGHHIISQGEADKFLNAGSKDRRDMLEDALGLKIYQYKREESERKLEKTEENMKSVESLRREIAPHLKFLKKQVEKIEKTAKLKDELRALFKEYFKREDVYIKNQKNAIIAERNAPEKELKQLEQKLAGAKAVLAKSSSSDDKSKEVIRLEDELSAVRAEKDALTREIGRLEGAIGSEERILRRERELAAQSQNKTVPLPEVEALGATVEEKIREAENGGGFQMLAGFLRKIFSEFIARHKSGNGDSTRLHSDEELEHLKTERDTLDNRLRAVNEKENSFRKTYAALQDEISKDKDSNREAERAVFQIMNEQNTVRAALSGIENKAERLRVIEEDFKRDLEEGRAIIGREVLDFEQFQIVGEGVAAISARPTNSWQAAEIAAEDRKIQEDRKRLIEKLKIRIEEAGGAGGEEIMKEYKETSERDVFLERELNDLRQSAGSLKTLIAELEEKLDNEFRAGVIKINDQFNHFFNMMFGGGSAKLSVTREVKKKKNDTDLSSVFEENTVPEEDGDGEEGEITEGIEIEVSLPRKKIKGLMMLSGGERALTSIALLFAISQVNPPPFIILDETDAALDEANSRKYGDMIDGLSKFSQLILITHNRETMSRAGVLYGVTMGSGGASKLLSIQFEEAVAVAK